MTLGCGIGLRREPHWDIAFHTFHTCRMKSSVVTRIVDRIVAWRIALLAMGVVAALVAFQPARQLRFDRSVENMFADGNRLVESYRQLKRTFGTGEIVVAAYDDHHLVAANGTISREGLARVKRLATQLEQIDDVAAVIGLHDFLDRDKDQDVLQKWFRPKDQTLFELFEGYTHSADRRTVALICLLKPSLDHRTAVGQLRKIVEQPPYDGVLAGEPVMVVDGFRYIEQDGSRLGWTSTLLLVLTIVVCFRSLRWVLIPLAVVQLTLLLTSALLHWSHFQLSMVSSMLTAIVTVVAVATVMHVIVRFREARAQGMEPNAALREAGYVLFVPIVWSCLTDAVGFLALTVAKVGPVQDFGIMLAIGALAVPIAGVLVLPGLALLGRYDVDPHRAWGERWLDEALRRLVQCVEHRPRSLAAGLAVLLVVSAVGVSRLDVETDFTKNFHADSPIVTSYEFVETRLGGAGVWDIILPAPKNLSADYLLKVRSLEARMKREASRELKRENDARSPLMTLSLADVVHVVTRGAIERPEWLGDFATRPAIAAVQDQVVQKTIGLMRSRLPGLLNTMHNEDPEQPGRWYFHVMLRSSERQPTAEKRKLIELVNRIAREEYANFEFANERPVDEVQVTGFFVLLTNLIDSVIADQWIAFAIAAVGIGLMMLVAYRSLSLALVALIPNVLPVFVVTGLLGWLGLKINMGAAMIAAVSLGLSIDSSVHYISSFLRFRREEKTVRESLEAAHQGVGRAMVFSTLALIVGFSALVQSNFVPTVYFGALVALSMLGGLLGNLLVLPLLLRMVSSDAKCDGQHSQSAS